MAGASGNDTSASFSINNAEERTANNSGTNASYNTAAAQDLIKSFSRSPRPRQRLPAQTADGNYNVNQPRSASIAAVADESSATAKSIHFLIVLSLIIHLVFLAILATLAWLANIIFPSTIDKPTRFGLHFQVYVHIVMWIAFMGLILILCRVHRTIRRTLSCLDLHNRTKRFENFLLIYHSGCKILVLLALTMVSDICVNNKSGRTSFLGWLCMTPTSTILLIQIITSVECLVAVIVTLLYLFRVIKHCRQDSYRMFIDSTGQFSETFSSLGGVPAAGASTAQQYLCSNEIGLQPDETQADIIEAQSDEINALKRHNEAMASKLLKTQEQLKHFNM